MAYRRWSNARCINKTLYNSWYKTNLIDLNGWSFMHAFSGMLFASFFLKQTLLTWIFIHTIWEIYQILIGMTKIKENTLEESIDIFFDTLFAVLGFILVQFYSR
jgi:hypothetical protein